jgi:hypothetical protein
MKPLFPFDLSTYDCDMLLSDNPEHAEAFRKLTVYRTVNRHEVTATVTEDAKVKINAWASSDSGFMQQAGTYWTKIIQLSQLQVRQYVMKEVQRRAIEEIMEEDRQEQLQRVAARAKSIAAKLGVSK